MSSLALGVHLLPACQVQAPIDKDKDSGQDSAKTGVTAEPDGDPAPRPCARMRTA